MHLGTIDLSAAPMKVEMRSCARCGAIIAVTFDGKGINNAAAHAAWHDIRTAVHVEALSPPGAIPQEEP